MDVPPREFLDLTKSPCDRDEGGVQLLREILTTSRKIIVIAGAGISVAAGIPDFRSSKGVFAQMKAKGRCKQARAHARTAVAHLMRRMLFAMDQSRLTLASGTNDV